MKLSVLLTVLACLLLIKPPLSAQSKQPQGSLDSLIDWADPWSLTPDKFKQIVDPMGANQKQPIYQEQSRIDGTTDYSFWRKNNPRFKINLFSGKLEVNGFTCTFRGDKLLRISFWIGETNTEPADTKDIKWLKDEMSRRIAGSKPVDYQNEFTARDGSKSMKTGTEWLHPNYIVRMFEMSFFQDGTFKNSGRFNIEFYLIGDNAPYEARPVGTPPIDQSLPKLSANLDALLNFAALWQWTPDDLEKNYVLKLDDQKQQQKPPQFEWVSASKERARFSRHMFSNVETKLTMFGGSINVEEAIVEFVNGKAARATLSFYNRGDSGDIEVPAFDKLFKTIGQNLGQVMKVAPKRQIMSANAALPVTSWMWSAPAGVALLEYNEYNTPGKVTKPEFLRMKLAAPGQADWSMGKMAMGVQRMELQQRVTKTPEGDIYISGVPMVDQGQKGYCVAASCQRLFEYMRIPCDQHEMAKLVSADAEKGANIFGMQKSLAKIDGAFKVTFKPLINPELYYTNGRKRRVSDKQFVSIIKEYTDKGVPLLWGLALGEKEEDPPLPRSGQISGGHMRLIIGYNTAKNQILFTDSWGAGHELKRMALLDAYDVTMGLYSMAPRGL